MAHVTCHLPSDMDTLLAAIESGFGSHTAFNIKVRVRVRVGVGVGVRVRGRGRGRGRVWVRGRVWAGVRVRARVRARVRVRLRVRTPPATSRCAARASRSYATCASARSRVTARPTS